MMSALLIRLIKAYQFLLSPWVGSNCRFTPTCSNYAIESLQTWGAFKGSWLTIKRISRCHPWAHGGNDPPPKNPSSQQ